MLAKFFDTPRRINAILRGPSGELVEDFSKYLLKCGYSEISGRQDIRAAKHVIHWAIKRDRSISAERENQSRLQRVERDIPKERILR